MWLPAKSVLATSSRVRPGSDRRCCNCRAERGRSPKGQAAVSFLRLAIVNVPVTGCRLVSNQSTLCWGYGVARINCVFRACRLLVGLEWSYPGWAWECDVTGECGRAGRACKSSPPGRKGLREIEASPKRCASFSMAITSFRSTCGNPWPSRWPMRCSRRSDRRSRGRQEQRASGGKPRRRRSFSNSRWSFSRLRHDIRHAPTASVGTL